MIFSDFSCLVNKIPRVLTWLYHLCLQAYIVLNVNADLRSEFTWNTKQIFVYVSVEFETAKNVRNEMTIWNAIIDKKENALISIDTLRAQYPFVLADQGYNLRGRQFDVTVFWNVMPRVGALYTRNQTFTGFTLPNEYIEPKMGSIRGAAAAAE